MAPQNGNSRLHYYRCLTVTLLHRIQLEERRAAVLSSLSDCLGKWALTPISYTEKVWSQGNFKKYVLLNY